MQANPVHSNLADQKLFEILTGTYFAIVKKSLVRYTTQERLTEIAEECKNCKTVPITLEITISVKLHDTMPNIFTQSLKLSHKFPIVDFDI